jgi:hypothetical protein
MLGSSAGDSVRTRQAGLPIYDGRLMIGAQSKIADRQSAILRSSLVTLFVAAGLPRQL